MPLHDFRCPAGHVTEAQVAQGTDWISCPVCAACTPECQANHKAGYDVLHLGMRAEKVFLKAPVGFVQKDICYDSPIDGRPITSKQARIEDLARSGCVEYDPGMKQDAARRRVAAEERLEAAVDETVEAAIEVMDSRKREKLGQELHAGATVEVTRPDGHTIH